MRCNERTHLCKDEYTGNTMVQVSRHESGSTTISGTPLHSNLHAWDIHLLSRAALQSPPPPTHTPSPCTPLHTHSMTSRVPRCSCTPTCTMLSLSKAALQPPHTRNYHAFPLISMISRVRRCSCTPTCTSGTCASRRNSHCTTSAAGRSCCQVRTAKFAAARKFAAAQKFTAAQKFPQPPRS